MWCLFQSPTWNSTLAGRVLLDLFSEPDIFGIKWDALTQYNGALYPALPDLYGPTMNVRAPPLFSCIQSPTHLDLLQAPIVSTCARSFLLLQFLLPLLPKQELWRGPFSSQHSGDLLCLEHACLSCHSQCGKDLHASSHASAAMRSSRPCAQMLAIHTPSAHARAGHPEH